MKNLVVLFITVVVTVGLIVFAISCRQNTPSSVVADFHEQSLTGNFVGAVQHTSQCIGNLCASPISGETENEKWARFVQNRRYKIVRTISETIKDKRSKVVVEVQSEVDSSDKTEFLYNLYFQNGQWLIQGASSPELDAIQPNLE